MNEIIDMQSYFTAIAYLGFALTIVSFLPLYTKKAKITYIVPLLIFGFLLYTVNAPLPWPDPLYDLNYGKIVTEIIVIISLMTAGLKIGTHYKWSEWKRPLSLIFITMPLFMVSVFAISFYFLGLNGPVSLLLAAVLAPTDPVLASEMQLKEQQHEHDKETGMQFTLTAEAGINDGLAFPFVFLAILWSKSNSFGEIDWAHFINFYLIYKILGGLLLGALIGYVYSSIIALHKKENRKYILNGFIAVALTFFSYGAAELLNTYGFMCVFATGVFVQHHRPKDKSKATKDFMVPFIEEIEKLLVVLWTIFFGGALCSGILNYTNYEGIVFSLVIVLILRPILGYLAMIIMPYSNAKRWAIGFFGIKGIGSVFYLSYGLLHGFFEGYTDLYGIVSYVILFSIIIHGLTSLRVLDYFNSLNTK
ncbi:cation:proton antiporter [Altibacter sp.]|uniref:cation:proton antiporter n=1 Tax=Altibacter sp. TaxID=2024823 RepID=UPI000C8C5DB3|nr:cation:proton antiporter [Altibacter sp.]MAP55694.1 sodium:proton antiporter [Altibacter sp.]